MIKLWDSSPIYALVPMGLLGASDSTFVPHTMRLYRYSVVYPSRHLRVAFGYNLFVTSLFLNHLSLTWEKHHRQLEVG